jgi:hypothetical protein
MPFPSALPEGSVFESQAEQAGITTTERDFEQAQKPALRSQFLQIVAKPKRAARKKPEPKLTRVAFKVSRLMEFCSERELQNQTGHSIYDWPLVVGKEIVDNALDACEEAEVAPNITIIVDPETIIIQDMRAGSIPRSSSRSSITRFACPLVRRMSLRPAAPRAMR